MNGNCPVFLIEGDTLPEVWEKSVLKVWNEGISIRTEYDKKDDPPSRDASVALVIRDPLAEPRIHRAFPAGLEELEVYRLEVVEGIHDHWICPEEGKWTYTYHKRIFGFETEGRSIDQIEYMLNKLCESTYTRRAQAITWNPLLDIPTDDPPCLQRIWCRLFEEDGGGLALNMNSHWRSRDAYKAAFMNIFALTDLQRVMAGTLAERLKRPVRVGRYADFVDSYHIYGSYFEEFKSFLNMVEKRTFDQRTWTSEFAEEFFQAGRERIRVEKEKGI